MKIYSNEPTIKSKVKKLKKLVLPNIQNKLVGHGYTIAAEQNVAGEPLISKSRRSQAFDIQQLTVRYIYFK